MMLTIHERGLLPSLEGAGLIAFHILAPYLRGWRLRWGATPAECRRVFPLDDVIAQPRWSYTHAITIAAPPAAVWPWLAQMGDGRAGLYSYQSLENLAGCKMRNSTAIEPALQGLKLGDAIKLHDKIPGLPVIHLVPGRELVIGGANGATDGAGATWAWILEPQGQDHTRLIERWRTTYPLTTANRLGYGQLFVEPITFVMARKMKLGIKARAEALARTSPAIQTA